MIENIRKYTGLLIVFFALVVLALVVGIKDDIFRGGASGQPVLKIAGRTYNDKEFHQFGSGALELAQFFAQSGDFGLYSFVLGLTSGAASQDEAAERFFINRMILRQAKDEFGVHPGNGEVEEYLKSMRAFAGPDGQFDEEAYRNFIDRGIGRLGMTEQDLRELAADSLASQKINAIVGSGLGQNREITASRIAMDDQRVSGHIASLSIDPFEAEIQPTDEEIEEYWETIQDAFMTEPRRKFTYVIATPEMPAEEPDAE
ncbi:MAG TPA: SurA N-terminal domain-containing protein [Luteolibacter sp.]|nr:SurA N-terminal domain-containing protein [Luteolibacter sp.]